MVKARQIVILVNHGFLFQRVDWYYDKVYIKGYIGTEVIKSGCCLKVNPNNS